MHSITLHSSFTMTKAETSNTLQLHGSRTVRTDQRTRKRKRTCSGARGEELHPGSSSSTSSPFSLDRSVHILLWENDNSAYTHTHIHVKVLQFRGKKTFDPASRVLATESPTSRVWTAFCDWLKDFCRPWSRDSEFWT